MSDRFCCGSGLCWLPISVVIIVPLTFLTTYLIAVFLGHVEAGFPYISDTGALPPESCIFGQFLNISAVLIGVTFYMRYKQIEELFRHDMSGGYTTLNKAALVLGICSALGISIVANFQEIYVLVVHLCGAVMAFGLGVSYCWIHTFLSFKLQPLLTSKCIAIVRLVICIVATIAFFMTFALDGYARHRYHGDDKRKWYPSDGGFTFHLISTVSEWVMAIMFLSYFVTFIPEMNRVSMAPIQVAFIVENSDARSGIFRTDDDIIT